MTKKVEELKQVEINIDTYIFNYVDLTKDEKNKFAHTHTTSDLRINPFFPIKKAPTEKEYPALFDKLKKDKYFTVQISNIKGELVESISFDYPKIKLQTLKKEIEKSSDRKRYIEEYAILNMIDKKILDAIMIYAAKNPKSKTLINNDMCIKCSLASINNILSKATSGNNDIQIRNTLEKLMSITIKRESNQKEKLYKIIKGLEFEKNEIEIYFSLDFFKYFMSSSTVNLSNVLLKIWSKEDEINQTPNLKSKKINMALAQSIIEFMISHTPLGYQYHLSKLLYYTKYIDEKIEPNDLGKVKNIKNIKSNLKYLIPFFREFGIEYCCKNLTFRYIEDKIISGCLSGL